MSTTNGMASGSASSGGAVENSRSAESCASAASSSAVGSTTPRRTPSARSRSGIRFTGVAVTTSRPKNASSSRSGTASGGPAAAIIGVEAAQPTMPPACLIRVAPPAIAGAPQPMCTSPSTPTTSALSPMAIRPFASGTSG